jgi:hypothetical protein
MVFERWMEEPRVLKSSESNAVSISAAGWKEIKRLNSGLSKYPVIKSLRFKTSEADTSLRARVRMS